LIIAGWTAMKQIFSRSEKANELRRIPEKPSTNVDGFFDQFAFR
jgi:hypothetical protein